MGSRPSNERRPHWPIEDIIDRTDLSLLLDQLAVPAGSAMRGRRWHCPLEEHDDRNPSVSMFRDARGHERWKCWSGDNSHRGDAIDLVQFTQRVDRAGAIEWLARRAGIDPDDPTPVIRKARPAPAPREPVPLDSEVHRYVAACERILHSRTGAPVREWLAGRGFTEDLVRANHIGADPGRKQLTRAKGLPYGSGLGATFPALDPAGELAYVQTRNLEPSNGPKYENPAAELGDNPRLGWTITPAAARPDVLVVCEGLPDALTAAQAGYVAVGVLGSQAPDELVARGIAERARGEGRRVVAIADADPAGRRWAETLTGLLEPHAVTFNAIEAPQAGEDLNSWARRDPRWSRHLEVGRVSVERDVRPPSPGLEL